jgi:hypothetical protein
MQSKTALFERVNEAEGGGARGRGRGPVDSGLSHKVAEIAKMQSLCLLSF